MVCIFHSIFEFLIKAQAVFKRGKDQSKGFSSVASSIGLATALKVTWKPFKVQFGDIIESISRQMQNIEHEVEIAEKEAASEERQKQEAGSRK